MVKIVQILSTHRPRGSVSMSLILCPSSTLILFDVVIKLVSVIHHEWWKVYRERSLSRRTRDHRIGGCFLLSAIALPSALLGLK